MLYNKDIERQKREIIRKKKLDKLNNVGYNIVNGKERIKIKLPIHTKSNYRDQIVNESFSERHINDEVKNLELLIGDDQTAGRPARRPKKEYGKKILNSWFDW